MAGNLDIWDEMQGACHRCDTPECVAIEHLFPGSQAANMQDAFDKGRVRVPSLNGEDDPKSKLTAVQVREILASTDSNPAIAKRFGVSKSAIWSIKNGLTWKAAA